MRRIGAALLRGQGRLRSQPPPQAFFLRTIAYSSPPAPAAAAGAAAAAVSARRQVVLQSPPSPPPAIAAARTRSLSTDAGDGSAAAAAPPHPSLAADEVERLEEEATAGGEGSWRASRELGMRYLTYGRRLGPDADKALEWLEKAGSQLQPDHPNSSSPSQPEVAELWYARALACRRVDQGLAARGVTAAVDGDEEEGGDGWEEEVETERYGARTGVEFVRVVRRRANRLKRARAKESAGTARVPPKHRRALRRFEQAAALGHVEAMIQMGNVFYESVSEEEAEAANSNSNKEGAENGTAETNLQRAVACYRRAATAEGEAGRGEGGGHPDAWYNLGTIYYEGGPGVPRDVPTALECFTAAAAHPRERSGSAAYWLGHLYRVGDAEGGVPSNRDKALRYLREACEGKQHPAACYYLALLFRNGEPALALPPDPSGFRTYLRKAEALNDPEALFCLADMHLHGTDGVAGRDEERAIEYYTRAGAAGHGGALTTLGALFHQRGRYAEALDLYQRAGEQGSLQAWRNLASMYLLGQGTAKNEAMAKHILKTIAKAEAEEEQERS